MGELFFIWCLDFKLTGDSFQKAGLYIVFGWFPWGVHITSVFCVLRTMNYKMYPFLVSSERCWTVLKIAGGRSHTLDSLIGCCGTKSHVCFFQTLHWQFDCKIAFSVLVRLDKAFLCAGSHFEGFLLGAGHCHSGVNASTGFLTIFAYIQKGIRWLCFLMENWTGFCSLTVLHYIFLCWQVFSLRFFSEGILLAA